MAALGTEDIFSTQDRSTFRAGLATLRDLRLRKSTATVHAEAVACGVGFAAGRTAWSTTFAFTPQFTHGPFDVGIAHRWRGLGRSPPRKKGIGDDSSHNQGQQDKDGNAHNQLLFRRGGQVAISVPTISTAPPIHSQMTKGVIRT
jgi:hypothetical protein